MSHFQIFHSTALVESAIKRHNALPIGDSLFTHPTARVSCITQSTPYSSPHYLHTHFPPYTHHPHAPHSQPPSFYPSCSLLLLGPARCCCVVSLLGDALQSHR